MKNILELLSGAPRRRAGSRWRRRLGRWTESPKGVFTRPYRVRYMPDICHYPSVGAWAHAKGLCKK